MKNADLLKSLKTLLCIPLTEETGLCPKAARLLPGFSSLVFVHAVSRHFETHGLQRAGLPVLHHVPEFAQTHDPG